MSKFTVEFPHLSKMAEIDRQHGRANAYAYYLLHRPESEREVERGIELVEYIADVYQEWLEALEELG